MQIGEQFKLFSNVTLYRSVSGLCNTVSDYRICVKGSAAHCPMKLKIFFFSQTMHTHISVWLRVTP